MYSTLSHLSRGNALTDDTKYPCPSLAVPLPPFGRYDDEPVYQNKEFFRSPPVETETPVMIRHTPRTPVTRLTTTTVATPQPSYPITRGREDEGEGEGSMEDDVLLPVLDCRFNLREICKQCILLEDHLSHDQKRCTDCCIKHFLAIEGLCEEAVTLDQDNRHHHLRNMAERVRKLQKLWYENPKENSHACSQELRKLRKQFQIDVFPMIFEAPACQDGVCRKK